MFRMGSCTTAGRWQDPPLRPSAPPSLPPSDGRRRQLKRNMIWCSWVVSAFWLSCFCSCAPVCSLVLVCCCCCLPCVCLVLPLCWFAVVACLVSVLCSPCAVLVPLLCSPCAGLPLLVVPVGIFVVSEGWAKQVCVHRFQTVRTRPGKGRALHTAHACS